VVARLSWKESAAFLGCCGFAFFDPYHASFSEYAALFVSKLTPTGVHFKCGIQVCVGASLLAKTDLRHPINVKRVSKVGQQLESAFHQKLAPAC